MSVLSAIRTCIFGDPTARIRDEERNHEVAEARAAMDRNRQAMESGVRLMKTFGGAMSMMEKERARDRN